MTSFKLISIITVAALVLVGGVLYVWLVRPPERETVPLSSTAPQTLNLQEGIAAPISQDFTLAASVPRASFLRGNFSDRVKLTISSQGGFAGNVVISVEGAPSSVTAKVFQKNLSIEPNGSASTDIRFGDPDMITPAGTYKIKINAVSGALTKSIPFEIEVQPMEHNMPGSFMPHQQ